MNIAYTTYRFLSTGLYFIFLPLYRAYAFICRPKDDSMDQRLGKYRGRAAARAPGSPRIWIHAASVGEVSVAISMIDALVTALPECAIMVSTTTRHGHEFAVENMDPAIPCIYAPIDFIAVVRRALKTFEPDALTCIETEIWPNWLTEAAASGVKTILVNGRISNRSINSYRRFRPVFRPVFEQMDAFSMIGRKDAERIRMIGAPEKKIEINGNAKYDRLIETLLPDRRADIRALLNLNGREPVLVAGSTRRKEEEIILDVYRDICREYPATVLIIAPRHVKRAGQVVQLVTERGLDCQLRTELGPETRKRTASVVVMDTIGELQAIYGVATIVFVGGSLVPLGGHNILEPAVWAKPVLHGPFMDDFLDAMALLEKAGGGIQVENGRELAERILDLLQHPEKGVQIGRAAKEAVMTNKGAAEKHAAVILRALNR
jgi:3-deoxy-D-manno-octulosonic-acid transferase